MLFFDAENSRKMAETASKTKSEFLANMSHELRTPLNSLLLLSQDLLENDEENLTSEQLEDVSVIYNGGKNLLTLINDILGLSKVEAGKMVAVVDEVAIETLMSNAKLSFGPVAEQKGLTLDIEASNDLPQTIRTDMTRLEQILRNFLSNALKFTHQGSVGLRNFVQDLMPDLIHFAVNDTGIGIPKDKVEAVFNAFEQVDGSTSREYGGTGLGLSICLELAALLGGKIQVESKQGKGSTFTLSIPMELETKARSGNDQVSFISPQEIQEKAMLQVIQEPPRSLEVLVDDRDNLQSGDTVILVVEDDKYFAKILLDKIRAQGFKGLIATDGHGGLQMVSDFRPDAVILDNKDPRPKERGIWADLHLHAASGGECTQKDSIAGHCRNGNIGEAAQQHGNSRNSRLFHVRDRRYPSVGQVGSRRASGQARERLARKLVTSLEQIS
jgi:hypothetical protein